MIPNKKVLCRIKDITIKKKKNPIVLASDGILRLF